ncbi:MAG TPA: ABC transporter permease [Solirubrobacteraceae bacterium]|nr:ABC transporter permease [Solirubrobacteraceae bacterium]
MRSRLDPAAIGGVMYRDLVIFVRYWKSRTFSSVVEPTIYLLAFGFGFGALVAKVDGIDYVEFVGTGVVATAVLFSSAFSGMFDTFIKRKYQRTYDALLAAPVDPGDVVTGEVTSIALKGAVYCMAPLLVAIVFGLDPSPWIVVVPVIGFVTGFGWASFGVTAAAIVPSIDTFNYIISAVITPLFLVAGTFFPIDTLPGWAQGLAQINPLYHTVQLVRAAVFDQWVPADLWHAAALLVFAVALWRIAIWRLGRRLID